jgi:hypothetical protein
MLNAMLKCTSSAKLLNAKLKITNKNKKIPPKHPNALVHIKDNEDKETLYHKGHEN